MFLHEYAHCTSPSHCTTVTDGRGPRYSPPHMPSVCCHALPTPSRARGQLQASTVSSLQRGRQAPCGGTATEPGLVRPAVPHRTAAAEVTRYAGAADPSAPLRPRTRPTDGRDNPSPPVTTSPFELKRRAHPRTGAPDRRLKPAVCTCTPAFLRNYARLIVDKAGAITK